MPLLFPAVVGFLALLSGLSFNAFQNLPSFGNSTLSQLSPWYVSNGLLRPASSTIPLRVPSLASLDCIGTDADGDFGAGSCTGGSGATTTINGFSGPAFTFATSSDTNIGLSITGSGSTLTFTSQWIGTLANSRLTNSTISGVALGSNLNALTNDATLNGSSYNGSSAISDWGLNLANANTWTALQSFVTASATDATSTNQSIINFFTFDGVKGDEWSDFCTAITGGAGLCDGTDATGGSGVLATTSPWTPGDLAYAVDESTLASVATGTLTTDAPGLEFDATRGLVGGAAVLSLSSGYTIPLTASTTEWATAYASTTNLTTFFDTPSTRITAGDALTWSGNTLNFDGGNSPGGVLGGTWASPTLDDNYLLNTGDIGTGNYTFTGNTALSTTTIGTYLFSSSSANYLDIHNQSTENYSIIRLKAPNTNPFESTLALLIDVDGNDDGTNEEFVDIYNEHYGDSLQSGFRQAYSGTGVAKPIVFGHWNVDAGSGGKDPGNKLILLPSGTVGIAVATSTLNTSSMLHIASSSATELLRVDSTPGTNKLLVRGGSGAMDVLSDLVVGNGTSLVLRNGSANSDIFAFNNGGSGANQFYLSDFTSTMPILLDGYVTAARFITTGLADFGGGILEIPNGTDPTADDVGEIAHDTTDNQLILDDFVIARGVQRIWSATIASTSPAFLSGGLLKVPTELDGYTMTAIRCSVMSGTSTVIAIEDESANSTEDITCATSVTSDDGSITNAGVTAAEEMYIDFGATVGAVDYVAISVFGTWTRE